MRYEPEHDAGKLAQVAYITLLALGVVALVAAVVTANGYVRAVKSIHQVDLHLRDLTFVDDENPRIELHFRVTNRAQLPMMIESYRFQLHLNEQRIGGSNSTYRGTDPNVAPDLYSKAAEIHEALPPNGQLDLAFTLYIYTAQQEIIRQAQQQGALAWTVAAAFQMRLPNAREPEWIEITTHYAQ